MARARGKRNKQEIAAPTNEQQAKADYELVGVQKRGQTVGRVYSKVRQLEALTKRGFFTSEESKALWVYRYNADLVERSLIRDSLAREMPGGNKGDGIPAYVLDAKGLVARYESAAGQLSQVMRAVIVDDMTPSQVAIERAGALEDCFTRDGVRICRLKPKQKHLEIVQIELKIAARRINNL